MAYGIEALKADLAPKIELFHCEVSMSNNWIFKYSALKINH